MRNQHSTSAAQPNVRYEYTKSPKEESSSLAEGILEGLAELGGGLFQVGPGYDPEEEAFKREMDRQQAKRKRKSRTIKR